MYICNVKLNGMWRSQVNLASFGNWSMLLKAGARSNRVIPTDYQRGIKIIKNFFKNIWIIKKLFVYLHCN